MDGATLAFDFAFKMWQPTVGNEIVVVFQEGETDEATLAEATDYTLSAANNDYSSGGTVTLNSGSAYITSGKTLLIKSGLPRSQTYNIETEGVLREAELEKVLDRVTRMISEAETFNSISQTALDTSILANFDKVVCYNNAVVCYNNEIVTFNP